MSRCSCRMPPLYLQCSTQYQQHNFTSSIHCPTSHKAREKEDSIMFLQKGNQKIPTFCSFRSQDRALVQFPRRSLQHDTTRRDETTDNPITFLFFIHDFTQKRLCCVRRAVFNGARFTLDASRFCQLTRTCCSTGRIQTG